MRKATNVERILCDVHDLCVAVANGEESIISAFFDTDDDLNVVTTDGTWEIGFGDEEEDK